MDLAWVGQIAPVVVPLLTAAFAATRGQRRLRANLRHDAETAKELAEGSPAQVKLLEHVNWQIDQLRRTESEGSRYIPGVAMGFALAVGFGYFTYWLLNQGAWWRWFGVIPLVLAIVGLYGIFESFGVAKRDHRGRRIKPSTPSSEVADGN